MVHSMTAFARYDKNYAWGKIYWEIRSLNQRYLDIHIDLPKHLYNLSWIIRKKIKNSINRGKIECVLQLDFDNTSVYDFNINKKLVQNLILSAQWIKKQINEGEINPLEILSWPGVIMYTTDNTDNNLQKELLICFEKTLDMLIQNKLKEGNHLKKYIEDRLNIINKKIEKIHQYMPDILQKKREKILEKIQNICLNIDTNRLEQELLILAQKIDVSEEITRLTIHIQEIYSTLSQSRPIGRKLDFLIQEAQRETNTITSKSINAYLTQLAISLKILIEQIREQIQNIE